MVPENLIECYCFDCKKFFHIDGNERIDLTFCSHCKSRNFDFNKFKNYEHLKKEKI